MLNGYRTYISAAAIMVIQVLNMFGFKDVTGEQLNDALTIIATILVFVFRMKAKPSPVK